MANAFVKSASAASTNAVTFGSAVAAGNLLVGVICYPQSDGPVTSVTDTLGNTYALLTEVADVGNDQAMVIFYAENIAGGTPTITANGVTPGGATSIIVHEVSGPATSASIGQSGGRVETNPGTGTDALDTADVTTTTDGEYVFCAVQRTDAFSTGSAIFTAGATPTYTERVEHSAGGALGVATEDHVQTSAGAIAGKWTTAAGTGVYTIAVATFKAAAGSTAQRSLPNRHLRDEIQHPTARAGGGTY